MNTSQLERECHTYTQYLIGQVPTLYVMSCYVDFHRKSDAITTQNSDAFDHFLVSVSARTPAWACLADCYARMHRKDSAVRKKLVLMLALLECASPSFEALDRADGRSALMTVLYLGWRAITYSVILAASVVIFTPVRLVITPFWKSRAATVLEH